MLSTKLAGLAAVGVVGAGMIAVSNAQDDSPAMMSVQQPYSCTVEIEPTADGGWTRIEECAPSAAPAPTGAPQPTATGNPAPTPTSGPTAAPTATQEPTVEATVEPTVEPTAIPTVEPTPTPTGAPSPQPTATAAPVPTVAPQPTAAPPTPVDLAEWTQPAWGDGRLPGVTNDRKGAHRIFCAPGQVGYWDPIVTGTGGPSMHEHQFFGNLSIDGSTTADTDLRGQPSTCQGGPVNATGYWTPTLYQAGQRVDPLRMLVYYKSPRDSQDVDQFLPAGLRMISDDGSWRCRNNRGGTRTSLDALAAAAGGSCNGAELRGTIHFPQCWDGVRLDSPDHRSHMAYAVGGVCPGTHPVLLPQVEEFIDYPGDNIRQLTISSDLGAEPGTTLHADWMNGWDAAAVDIIMEHCIQAGKSCNAGDMGDGRQLTGSNTIDDIN